MNPEARAEAEAMEERERHWLVLQDYLSRGGATHHGMGP